MGTYEYNNSIVQFHIPYICHYCILDSFRQHTLEMANIVDHTKLSLFPYLKHWGVLIWVHIVYQQATILNIRA